MKAIIMLLLMYQSFQIEKVQSIYIYQFTRQIDWCAEQKSGDFIIGVLGESAILGELQKLAQAKKVGDRSIAIKKISNLSEIKGISVLVISNDASSKLNAAISAIGNDCILLVSLKDGHAKNGAAISLKEKDGKITFQLNSEYFDTHNLKVSTQLLNLAEEKF